MNNFNLVTVLLLIMLTANVMGQQIIKCDSIKSSWVINKDHFPYAVRINGKCNQTERPNVIVVKKYVLQYLIVDKKEYIKDKDTTDLKVLVTYAMSEAKYLSEQFKTNLNLQMQKAPLSGDKEILIWYFEMPAGANQQVKYQIYANVIFNNQIIGFASPQFAYQKFENVRDFLMDTISSIRKADNINNLCDE
jgi:hypothetical protein